MVNANANPQLLILGGHDSGKSTFRGQVFQRLEHKPGALKLLKSVGDITAIENDAGRLSQGLQPMHTSTDTYVTTDFSLIDADAKQYQLKFADFDGEQLRKMSGSNVVPSAWTERAQLSDSWLFFLRIDHVRSVKSFMTHPVEIGPRPEAKPNEIPEPAPAGAVTETNAIEMFQRLLFVRGTSLRHKFEKPRLGVLLSCWDELALTERSMAPDELLKTRAPLFFNFLQTNWRTEALRIWGLSSTEKPLPPIDPDREFARKGAENFGYVVTGPNEVDKDLTAPIQWLVQPQ